MLVKNINMEKEKYDKSRYIYIYIYYFFNFNCIQILSTLIFIRFLIFKISYFIIV